MVQRGYGDVFHVRAQSLQHGGGVPDGLSHLRVDYVVEVLLRQADAQALYAPAHLRGEVLGGRVRGRRVSRVVAGYGVQHEAGVLGGAGHRACGVQAEGERIDAVAADAPEGGLEAHDAAEGRRDADGAAGVAAERGHALAGRDGRAGAAA